MGGKTSTSTSGVSIPPSVLAQYNSVNAQAQQTAQTPFQQYNGQFVAPVNTQQQTGITNTNAAAEEAQPYYGAATSTLGSAQSGVNPVNAAATGLAGASAEQVNAQPLTGSDINQYLSPYLGDVLGTTNALANQNNSIAQSGALGTAISSGAFGGDRTGLAAANLNQQNQLAEQATDANILNTGYNTALSTAQQQQGVNLGAAQANRTALGAAGSELASIGSTAYGEGANTASELGSLGTGAQSAGLAGAQAQIGAGTLQQQTQQAQDTAEYNQFLQQQSYPFQVDQFLANIAEGTGALSGSTTTTTQPGGFFSDKRLKHDIKKIGKLFDGQEIYSYKMHGDPRTHIGLIAQKVEKKHPEAVGLARGYKIVDYGKATQEAANRSHFAGGGLARRAYAYGGSPDLADILTAHEAMYGSSPGGSGAYGLGAGSIPRGGSQRVPAGTTSGAQLHPAQGPTQRPPTGMQNVTNLSNFGNTLAKDYQGVKGVASNAQGAYQQNQADSAMATTNQQIANDPTMQGLLGAAPDLSSGATAAAPIADDMSVMDDAAMFANRGGRFALGGAPGGMAARSPMHPPGGLSAGAMPMMGNAGLAARPRGYASGGGPYSNDVGAGSTELSIPTASGSSGMGGLAAAPPPAQSGSSDPLASLDKYDPAMQGIMASTQGQIKFDYGGVVPGPQTDVPQSLDIPDQSGSGGGGGNKLAVATPPAGPSAGQQDMQDIMEVAGIVAMFANRGGRIGKDDGGSISDDSDPDLSPIAINPNDAKVGLAGASDTMLPEATVTAQRPDPVTYTGGLSAPPPAPANPTAPDAPRVPADAKPDKDTPSTWTKIMDGLHAAGLDKATNVVPLLTGLAAMGTAPTRSLGVALAAGLGAGAQAYLPAQQQGAEIQRTQAQAQQIGLQNQITRGAIQGMPGGRPQMPEPMRPPGMVSGDPTDPQEVAFSRYAPLPTARPDSVNQQVTAMSVLRPATAKFVGDQYDQMVQGANQRRQQGANAGYQSLLEVNSAQPGQALSALAKSPIPEAQQKATQLQQSGADPATLDQQARAYAQQLGLGTHQYTARGTDVVNGVMIDKPTNAPVLGSSQVMTGLTPEAKSAAFDEAVTPKTYGAGLPEAPYRHFGFASPEAYVIAKDRAARLSGAPGAAPTGTTAPPSGPSAPTRSGTPGAPPGVAAPLGRASTPPMLPGVNINSIPKLPAPSPATDQVSLNKANKQTDQNLEIQKEALAPLKTQTETAARNTAIYSQLEKTLANSDPREFGPSSSTYRALANFKTYLSGIPPDGLVNLNEADKYLAQLGVPGSKQLLGSDQQLRQQELLMLMAHANPNIDQPLQVIKNLAAFGKAGNSYDLLAGNTAIAAIRHGADPFAVPGAIEGQVHRADYIQQQLGVPFAPPAHPGTGRTVVRTGIYNGKKVTQYSDGTIE